MHWRSFQGWCFYADIVRQGGLDDTVRIWDCAIMKQVSAALGEVKEADDILEPG
jgi:hypothetical protein